MLIKILTVTGILTILAVLLLTVAPAEKETFSFTFDNVDDTDKTKVALTYGFKPGQRVEILSEAEIVTSTPDTTGFLKIDGDSLMDVISIDEAGNTTINVSIKKISLESGAGFDSRKVEITPSDVHVFYSSEEVKAEPEDIQVQKALSKSFNILVSPIGEVSFLDVFQREDFSTEQIKKFLTSYFALFPEQPVGASDEWSSELPVSPSMTQSGGTKVKSTFLGYKDYEDNRCVILKQNFSRDIPSAGGESEQDAKQKAVQGHVEFNGGVVYSQQEVLPLYVFGRIDATGTAGDAQGNMQEIKGSSQYTVRVTSISYPSSFSGKDSSSVESVELAKPVKKVSP